MALPAGTRLGPYEILAPLGSGGMGEVYRARDTRLGRDVAIKVVPPAVATNPATLGRFEREARAVAALSHPNILALYDVGASNGVSYAVLELLEGDTLRARLSSGPLPQRKTVEVAAQIARGLAAAHEKHIVHRDLKPENIFVTSDGSVKILDFGLARDGAAAAERTPADSPTIAPATEPGLVLGTVGYMAPEQVRGEPSDHRADIFALGCVLYEMLTGRRAYQRDSAPETMTAILKEDPPDPSTSGIAVAPAVQRIVRRCLEKRPEERFQSTRDLAFALESSLDASSAAGTTAAGVTPTGRWVRNFRWVGAGLLVGAVLGSGGVMMWRAPSTASITLPSFRQLTFDRGTIRDARFTPDGQSVVYSAAWGGNPIRIFMTRTDAAESVRLSLPDARLLSISPTGQMAISLGHTYEGWMGMGTLAQSSVLGSTPRGLAEHVREADWAPNGTDLAVVRRAGALEQLEFPLGHVIYRTSGFISHVRVSPSGDQVAFADHPIFADDAGGVSVVDRNGRRVELARGYQSVRGVAWAPDGHEVWFSGVKGEPRGSAGYGLYAATLDGRQRIVWSSPSFANLFDISREGRVLIGHETAERRVEAMLAGADAPVDVSLRAASTSQWIAPDGRSLTIADQLMPKYASYLLKADGTTTLLGEGQSFGVSPDGRSVAALPIEGAPVLIHPTGAGESRSLPNPDHLLVNALAWLPDSRHIVMVAQTRDKPSRGYVQDIDGGPPRPFTPEGVVLDILRWWLLPVSPDGTRLIGRTGDGVPAIFRLADGGSEPLTGVRDDEVPVEWTPDGKGLLVARGSGTPWIVERMDLATVRRTPVTEIRAREAAGLRLSTLAVSPDGRYWAHSYSRLLTELMVVDGLK